MQIEDGSEIAAARRQFVERCIARIKRVIPAEAGIQCIL
jgi:hypothetical protein